MVAATESMAIEGDVEMESQATEPLAAAAEEEKEESKEPDSLRFLVDGESTTGP